MTSDHDVKCLNQGLHGTRINMMWKAEKKVFNKVRLSPKCLSLVTQIPTVMSSKTTDHEFECSNQGLHGTGLYEVERKKISNNVWQIRKGLSLVT
jgi:hypothetical protein